MNKKITVCKKACVECGFTKDGSTNTLYNEMYEIVNNGVIFPCHMYLKSQTGSENQGTELLNEIPVCRGYVAFVKKNGYDEDLLARMNPTSSKIWVSLLNQIEPEELDNICTLEELESRHLGLREHLSIKSILK